MQLKQQTNAEILLSIQQYKKQGIKVLLAALLMKMIIGVFFAWPIIFSYHCIMVQFEFQTLFKKGLLYFTFPLMYLAMNLSTLCTFQFLLALPRGDKVIQLFGPKSAVLLLASTISLAFTLIGVLRNIMLLVLIVAPCIGFLYMIPFQTTWKYFVKQKGQLNSIFQVFISLGVILTICLFESNQQHISPLELYFDTNEAYCAICFQHSIRDSYVKLGLIVFQLGAMASLLINTPEGKNYTNLNSFSESTVETMIDYDLIAFSHQDIFKPSIDSEMDLIVEKDTPTLPVALRSKHFKIMILIALSTTFLTFMFMGQYQKILQTFGIKYIDSLFLFKLTIVCFGCFRYIVTLIADQVKYKYTMGLILIIKVINFWFIFINKISLLVSMILGIAIGSPYIIVFCVSSTVVMLSGVFATFSIYIPRVFGPNIAQSIFTIIVLILAVSNLFAHWVSFIFMEVPFSFKFASQNLQMAIMISAIIILILQIFLLRILIRE